jgi:stage II sporulation protein D
VTVIHRDQTGEQNPESVEVLPPGEIDSAEKVRVLTKSGVATMTMSRYLQGVVRAEMPASFEQEALCAQAVAARTYTLYKISSGGNHGTQADVCTDPTCCQAYLDQKSAASNWGARAQQYEAKIENAVAATDGQTILYNKTPILAVFHSSSAGRTKSAGEVWSNNLPYLQSVESPEKGDAIPNYYSRVEFSKAKFCEKFRSVHPKADFSGSAKSWIQDLTVTEGTNVNTVVIGGIKVRGAEVRTIFSLRSASFETGVEDGKIVFYVTGYGHGVGMSQYGANEMAREGKTWREIIQHYYTGVSIAAWSRNGAA